MKGSSWIMAIYIICIFGLMFCINIFVLNYNKINDNWNDYKCSPLIMPFAGAFGRDPTSNFTECISAMQGDFMKIFLQPIEYVIALLGDSAKMFTTAIQDIREVLDKVRTFLSSILEKIFGIFLNVILEVQKLIISIKDLVGKLIGVLITSLYLMDTSVKTMESIWNGPPGQLLNALCFHPKTKIKLKNGKILHMEQVKIGDILQNGSEVYATMKIKNKKDNKYLSQMYCFKNGIDNEPIFVTDGHLVEISDNNFTYVKNHPDSYKCSQMNSDELICFITNDHIIQIGDYKFGDWEDEGTLPNIISHQPKNIF
tara:strand:+ start:1710 stop:2648 length:939 start_codon:yes stop_codon:yes gene_type:complete